MKFRNNEAPIRHRAKMVWSEGSEIVTLEEGMILTLDNLLRLNPHLKDRPNLSSVLLGQVSFHTVSE